MIRSQQLAFHYPGGAGLTFAEIDLQQGAALLLRGSSDSGKSTFLTLAAGGVGALSVDCAIAYA
jgi:energy-coupling factor transporter ATP-binding protein EcfA2